MRVSPNEFEWRSPSVFTVIWRRMMERKPNMQCAIVLRKGIGGSLSLKTCPMILLPPRSARKRVVARRAVHQIPDSIQNDPELTAAMQAVRLSLAGRIDTYGGSAEVYYSCIC